MRQFDGGYGNYTEEREELLKDITLEEIERELEEATSNTNPKSKS